MFAHPSLVIFRQYGKEPIIYAGDLKSQVRTMTEATYGHFSSDRIGWIVHSIHLLGKTSRVESFLAFSKAPVLFDLLKPLCTQVNAAEEVPALASPFCCLLASPETKMLAIVVPISIANYSAPTFRDSFDALLLWNQMIY